MSPRQPPISRAILALSCFGLSIALGYAYFSQYFQWRTCFNKLGRCFDPDTGIVYQEQSAAVWLSASLLAFCVFVFQLLQICKHNR